MSKAVDTNIRLIKCLMLGPVTINSAAERLGVSTATVWNNLDQLVDSGLVEKIRQAPKAACRPEFAFVWADHKKDPGAEAAGS